MKPEVISFDVDGTLARKDFIDEFYFEVVPKLYKEYHDMSFEAALEAVKEAYDGVGPNNINWYKPSYWVERFGFEESAQELIERAKHTQEIYEETEEVLKKLQNYRLIVISNAPMEFVNVQLEDTKDYFDEIYSCVSHFDKTKNDHMVYEIVYEEMDVVPKNVVHVGDEYKLDYKAAKKAGAKAFYLDRKGKKDGDHVINGLTELLEILK
ncbi:MAG: HAD family hydrolase [Candidatus Aenigmatarchaeota archaeon]